MAGNVARRGAPGDVEAGLALAAPLVRRLDQADDAPAREGALRALGNAGLPEHLDAVRGFASDSSSGVRRAVAAALRKVDTAPSRGIVLALAADSDAGVAGEAIQTLAAMTLEARDWQRLGAIAHADVLEGVVAADLVNTLSFHRDRPEVRSLLIQLLARPSLPGKLQARITALLE